MRRNQIEAWALRVIDRVVAGNRQEDSFVELKSRWPLDHSKSARQIAGLANAACGENVMWIIGVDEEDGLIGAGNMEFSNWWQAVTSSFDGITPDVTPLAVQADGKSVTVMLFETDRAPFVVKNAAYGRTGGGNVELEVPWRNGNSTRSATRSDLIRLLTPLETKPSFEVLDGSLSLHLGGSNPQRLFCSLALELYIVPKSDRRLVIPFFKCSGFFSASEAMSDVAFKTFRLRPPTEPGVLPIGPRQLTTPRPKSLTIAATDSEVIIDGPGILEVHGSAELPDQPITVNEAAEVSCTFQIADSNHSINLHLKMLRTKVEEKLGTERFEFQRS